MIFATLPTSRIFIHNVRDNIPRLMESMQSARYIFNGNTYRPIILVRHSVSTTIPNLLYEEIERHIVIQQHLLLKDKKNGCVMKEDNFFAELILYERSFGSDVSLRLLLISFRKW